MAELIKPTEIAGGTVYGVRQMSYTVDGVSDQDYGSAIAAASFKESVAIESSASAYMEVVRQREKKVSELGDVLAVLAKAISTMDPKSNNTDKKSDGDSALVTAKSTCAKYGISLSLTDGNKITFKNAQTAQTNVQYALDKEDNTLQQDIITLRSYITKRDNAYSLASRIIDKANRAASKTINNIGE
jgi:hypothetical protein